MAISKSIKVTRSEPTLVHPAAKTNAAEYYFLSNLDQNIAVIMKTVHCYKACPEKNSADACQVLREALGKVLVYYYPYDGSLAISPDGRLIVRCDDRGVPFAEAVADCELQELGDVTCSDPTKLGQLVYTCPNATSLLDTPLLTVQVTKFKCGGFVLGVAMNHALADGLSAVGFLNSWAETARGLPLSTKPFMDRTIQRARNPPKIEFPHNEFADIQDVSNLSSLYSSQDFVYHSFTFDSDTLNGLKQTAAQDGLLRRCSSFAALSAFIWRARTVALNMSPNQKTNFLFAVDGRNRSDPPLPPGFFGNGMVFACCLCEAGELVNQPLSYAVRLVENAIEQITDRYIRSCIDYFEVGRAKPSLTTMFLVTSWTRLDFDSVDFGWGEATQTGPAELPRKEVAFFLPSRKESSESISVVMGLPASSMEIFQEMCANCRMTGPGHSM